MTEPELHIFPTSDRMNTFNQRVRIIAIPPGLPQDNLNTPKMFAKFSGHSFEMVDRNGDLLELAVGEIMRVAPYIHINNKLGMNSANNIKS